MQKATINGLGIELSATGAGENVVLVHGDVSDRRSWDGVAPRLAKGARVLTYSRRHHWPNPPPAPGEGSQQDAHVADLAAFIEETCGGSAHVVGHSYGGHVALVLAARDPARVKSLVLEEPASVPLAIELPPTPEGMRALLARDEELAGATQSLIDACVGPTMASILGGHAEAAIATFADYHATPGERTPARAAQVEANGGTQVAALLHGHFAPFSLSELGRVRAPTLLVTGTESPAYLRVLARRIAAAVPRARLVEIRGAGHFAHEEKPDEFARETLDFLRAATGIRA